MKPKSTKQLAYQQQRLRIEQFLQNFQNYSTQEIHEIYGRKKYLIKLQSIADELANTFEVDFEDAEEYFRKEDEKVVLKGILQNTKTYIAMFTQAAEKLMPQRRLPVDTDKEMIERYENILREQRKENVFSSTQTRLQKNERLPTSLHQKYSVSIVFGNNQKTPLQPMNNLKADQIGHLIVTKGIVTRVSEVKPEIMVATSSCDVCGCENYQEVFDISYYPLTVCQSAKCRENKVSGRLIFLPGHSRFVAYQQVKIQQTPDQLNPGQIPITKTLYLRGCQVNTCSPGDIILIQAILLPLQRPGFRGRFQQSYQTYLLGLKVTRQKKKYVEWSLTQTEMQRVHSIKDRYTEGEMYEKLAAAIAPEIYGLGDVKKALLLMMAGGVTKETTTDNLKIRGEINVALIGDPGVAKSQLLKKVATIAPRAIYTTGKGSSGVGLTAAIVRDEKTKEIALQAGALVLADMGICCIDEFDKMSEYDRTSIHEAMQQQTISIAKAGITTTLNARTSILAAANPLYGRYKRSQTLHKNINLPAALLSRFDIVFILIDKADQQKDLELAYHISTVHMNERPPELTRGDKEIDVSFLRTYLAMAKQYKPVISKELHKMLIMKYIEKRKLQADSSRQGETYTTTRSLLAVIRLSIARAKLRFSNQVSHGDITDSLQIIEKSQQTVTQSTSTYRKPRLDDATQIFNIIKYMCLYSKEKKSTYEDLRNKVLVKGFKEEDLQAVIKNYQELCVLQMDGDEVMLLD